MKEPIILPLIFLLPTFCTIFFFLGAQFGYYSTRDKTIDFAVTECIEKPKDCKLRYDYIKLGERVK